MAAVITTLPTFKRCATNATAIRHKRRGRGDTMQALTNFSNWARYVIGWSLFNLIAKPIIWIMSLGIVVAAIISGFAMWFVPNAYDLMGGVPKPSESEHGPERP